MNDQDRWHSLEDVDRKSARAILIRRLREAADLIEKGGYPDVFGCNIPAHDEPLCRGEYFIDS